MTRVTFSADRRCVDVTLPTAWAELTQAELPGVLEILAAYAGIEGATDAEVRFTVFRRLGGMHSAVPRGEVFDCTFTAPGGSLSCRLSPAALDELTAPLEFLFTPGDTPVRPDSWRGHVAVDACLHGVSFARYLELENLYQGFLGSKNVECITDMAAILYPGITAGEVDATLRHGVLLWMMQLKGLFGRMWPDFFKPAGQGAGSAAAMLDVMNAEIRALTGGDVCKEPCVFDTDCWRALTELNFKAREAAELSRQLSKH